MTVKANHHLNEDRLYISGLNIESRIFAVEFINGYSRWSGNYERITIDRGSYNDKYIVKELKPSFIKKLLSLLKEAEREENLSLYEKELISYWKNTLKGYLN